MPLTLTEVLADLAPALQLAKDIEEAVGALPPVADRKPSDYMRLTATILTSAAPLADTVAEQAKD